MRSFSMAIILMHSKITKTLQVPGNTPYKNRFETVGSEKNVLPFTSRKETCFCTRRRLPASFTVEAALCLPLFVFFAAALMEPMMWLDRQRKVQTVLEAVAEDFSTAAYWKENICEQGEGEETRDPESEEERLAGMSDAAAGLLVLGKAGSHADSLVLKKSQTSDSDGNICLEVSYREKIPFFERLGTAVIVEAGARRRPWLGFDGKLKANKGAGGGGSEEAENQYVYVGAGMGRYHLMRSCHYISNEYMAVSEAEASQMKNFYGSRYKACARCCKDDQSYGTVYITRAGGKYHGDQECSAMASYVRQVPLEEVEHLGSCSYCGGKGGNK